MTAGGRRATEASGVVWGLCSALSPEARVLLSRRSGPSRRRPRSRGPGRRTCARKPPPGGRVVDASPGRGPPSVPGERGEALAVFGQNGVTVPSTDTASSASEQKTDRGVGGPGGTAACSTSAGAEIGTRARPARLLPLPPAAPQGQGPRRLRVDRHRAPETTAMLPTPAGGWAFRSGKTPQQRVLEESGENECGKPTAVSRRGDCPDDSLTRSPDPHLRLFPETRRQVVPRGVLRAFRSTPDHSLHIALILRKWP